MEAIQEGDRGQKDQEIRRRTKDDVVKKEVEIDLSGIGLSSFQDLKSINIPSLAKPETVVALNLAKNDLKEWFTIMKLVKDLPALTELNVSKNPNLAYVSDHPFSDVLEFKKTFLAVTHVMADGLGYSWGPVMSCVREMWSEKISYLSIRDNGIDFMSEPTYAFEYLKKLDLSGNPIHDWSQVTKLGSLPNLKSLVLKKCQISEIVFLGMPADLTPEFPVLKSLDFSENKLSSWKHVLELTRLNCLKEINLAWNPIVEPGYSFMESTITCHALFGRFAKKINGLAFKDRLVRDAEAFLRNRIVKKEFDHTEYTVVQRILLFSPDQLEDRLDDLKINYSQG